MQTSACLFEFQSKPSAQAGMFPDRIVESAFDIINSYATVPTAPGLQITSNYQQPLTVIYLEKNYHSFWLLEY